MAKTPRRLVSSGWRFSSVSKMRPVRILKPSRPGNRIASELGLHRLEKLTLDDWFMLTAMHLAPIDDLADVEDRKGVTGTKAHRRCNRRFSSTTLADFEQRRIPKSVFL
jgi:hypothetical protein